MTDPKTFRGEPRQPPTLMQDFKPHRAEVEEWLARADRRNTAVMWIAVAVCSAALYSALVMLAYRELTRDSYPHQPVECVPEFTTPSQSI